MREASVNEALARLTKHMSQTGFDLKVNIRNKPRATLKVKRAEGFKAMPLDEGQLTWAIGHNLQWVLSVIQPAERAQ